MSNMRCDSGMAENRIFPTFRVASAGLHRKVGGSRRSRRSKPFPLSLGFPLDLDWNPECTSVPSGLRCRMLCGFVDVWWLSRALNSLLDLMPSV